MTTNVPAYQRLSITMMLACLVMLALACSSQKSNDGERGTPATGTTSGGSTSGSDKKDDKPGDSGTSDGSGGNEDSNKSNTDDGKTTGTLTVDDQTPPTDATAMAAWLKKGAYLDWICEDEPHAARPKSPHSRNRVCSNTKLSKTPDDQTFPVGAATVKELYEDDEINGYAVMLHVKTGDSKDSWYYYEIIGSNVVADGKGVNLCDGCHAQAGQDGADGHHRIFTKVR